MSSINLDGLKLSAINGRSNSQLCLPNNVKNCCVRLQVAKSLTGGFQTLRNNSQQHATTCNNMQHGVQTDATGNIQQCWELLALQKQISTPAVIAYAWRISGSQERTMCSEI